MFHRFLITQMPLFGFPFLGRSGGSLGEVFYKHFPSSNPFLHGLCERFGEVGRSISKFRLFEDRISFVAKRGVAPLLHLIVLLAYFINLGRKALCMALRPRVISSYSSPSYGSGFFPGSLPAITIRGPLCINAITSIWGVVYFFISISFQIINWFCKKIGSPTLSESVSEPYI